MEILNQVTLAGNLTDKPSVDDAGGRVFVRARLAQNWFYDTHGKTVEHREFLPLTFLGESASVAKSFQRATTSTLSANSFDVTPEPALRKHRGPVKQEAFSRSTSFEHSASRAPPDPKPPRSIKTKFGVPTMRSRFPHLFRRASMIGLSN